MPRSASNPKVNAAGFARWVKEYNKSGVAFSSRPSNADKLLLDDYYLVSSDLKRAVQSSQIMAGDTPQLQLPILREMDIPRFKVPLKMNAWSWVYLNRALWILGGKGRFETFVQGKARAKEASEILSQLAGEHKKVAVFGHGYTNIYIRKYLIKAGWQLSQKSNEFWGVSRLTAPK